MPASSIDVAIHKCSWKIDYNRLCGKQPPPQLGNGQNNKYRCTLNDSNKSLVQCLSCSRTSAWNDAPKHIFLNTPIKEHIDAPQNHISWFHIKRCRIVFPGNISTTTQFKGKKETQSQIYPVKQTTNIRALNRQQCKHTHTHIDRHDGDKERGNGGTHQFDNNKQQQRQQQSKLGSELVKREKGEKERERKETIISSTSSSNEAIKVSQNSVQSFYL